MTTPHTPQPAVAPLKESIASQHATHAQNQPTSIASQHATHAQHQPSSTSIASRHATHAQNDPTSIASRHAAQNDPTSIASQHIAQNDPTSIASRHAVRLIERAFPLRQASLDSVHEKNVRHGHISTLHIWPARRPLAACRAALIATLLPDPGTPEARQKLCEKIGGKLVKNVERKKMPNGSTVERETEETQGGILRWKRETENAADLAWFRQEIRKAYGGRAPKVLDPFAGGGAIPLEAMRLGCEATAVDINPVAWFILKCTLEYPQKLAGKTHPLPDFILENEAFMYQFYKAHPHLVGRTKKTKKQKEDEADMLPQLVREDSGRIPKANLAWHVRAWGQWVLDNARQELASFYPTYAEFLPASGFQPSAQTSFPAYLPINRKAECFVYVLKCADGSFYIGQTDNLDRRYSQHFEGEVSWTASRRPLELTHWEELASRQEAVKREDALKTGFGRKWIQREYAAKRLRVQLYATRRVPLKDDGTYDIDKLNAEFSDPFSCEHDWGRPACATERREVAGRWIAKPTVAYLWARTVTCKNCRATLPLLKTRWLCKKANKRVLLGLATKSTGNTEHQVSEPSVSSVAKVVFSVETNVPLQGGNATQRREHDKRIAAGTMSRSGATCPCCSTIMTMEDIRVEGKAGRLNAIMTAVVTEGQKGKEYRLPTESEILATESTEITERIEQLFAQIPFGVPEEPTPKSGSGASRAFSVDGYGFDQWKKLFTPRQLLALGTFTQWTRATWDKKHFSSISTPYPDEWQEAIGAYLAMLLDKTADYSSMVCTWHNGRELIGHTFARFALPITWDNAELAVINNVGGSHAAQLGWIVRYIEHALIAASNAPSPDIINRSSSNQHQQRFDAIITDPPYYDAIGYSVLMDFFYVWLKRSLYGLAPDIDASFVDTLAPKWDKETNDGELIDDASRHDGDRVKSKEVYEDGMAKVFEGCGKSLTEDGRLVVVFANKQPDAWETLVSAIIRAGFVVTGSWPIQTEMGTRMRAMSSAALASSVWLVCRKRSATARPGWDNLVVKEMRTNIQQRLREYWDAGIRGPDFVWSATGPAMEAYSKHPVVKKANEPGPLSVSEFLTQVRRIVVEFVVGRVLSGSADQATDSAGERLDEPTAYYLLHRNDFGMDNAPAGACILYAVSCGISDRELAQTWDLIHSGRSSASIESDNEDDEVSESSGASSGSQIRLKGWSQRKGKSMGYEAPGGREVPLIDRVHRLMHLWKEGNLVKVDAYLDDNGLRRQELFKRLLQSIIELASGGSEERSLLESISNHIGTRGAIRDEQGLLNFATEKNE